MCNLYITTEVLHTYNSRFRFCTNRLGSVFCSYCTRTTKTLSHGKYVYTYILVYIIHTHHVNVYSYYLCMCACRRAIQPHRYPSLSPPPPPPPSLLVCCVSPALLVWCGGVYRYSLWWQGHEEPMRMENDTTFAPRQGTKSTWTHVKISGTKVVVVVVVLLYVYHGENCYMFLVLLFLLFTGTETADRRFATLFVK